MMGRYVRTSTRQTIQSTFALMSSLGLALALLDGCAAAAFGGGTNSIPVAGKDSNADATAANRTTKDTTWGGNLPLPAATHAPGTGPGTQPAPTSAPTSSPTSAPISIPTAAPTPTVAPTQPSDATPTPVPSPTTGPGHHTSQTFGVSKQQGKVDLVWVIDNSSSMTDKATIVQNNFQNFLQSLESKTDLHLALISAQATQSSNNTGVTLPESADTHRVQIVETVASTNGAAIAAAASCPQSATAVATVSGRYPNILSPYAGLDAVTGDVCGAPVLRELGYADQGYNSLGKPNQLGPKIEMEGLTEVNDAAGKLLTTSFPDGSSFFRNGAKRVYVFVSDDELKGVTDRNFASMINAPAGSKLQVFAFAATPKSSCLVAETANHGAVYAALAAATGGKVFDVCLADWSSSFAELTRDVAKIANSDFELPVPIVASVDSVSVDGYKVAPSLYKVTEGNPATGTHAVVTLSPGVLYEGSEQVVISFTYP